MMSASHDNPAFNGGSVYSIQTQFEVRDDREKLRKPVKERDRWGNGIEFLLSCIAMSVGLGNVWRFPFVALENGGGAFVIPYVIVLLLVGKPIYFMEMVMGQFSSRGSVKVYDCVPALRGAGVGQLMSTAIIATYYSSLMALTLKYLSDSFNTMLPWSTCKPEWGSCLPSTLDDSNITWSNATKSSAELYFLKDVLRAKDNIEDGLGGWPKLDLVIFLAISWTMVFIILVKGVKSSGKASYVLAIFPYVVLSILLARALTLPGAMNGVKYFLSPQWNKILDPKVWYAAVTQCFFSLSVCFGHVIMYSSYNKFGHNVYRDANIVTSLDTFTSLLAGCCIFGILGHLAHELNVEVKDVVKDGAGLAFISYPEAIAKFKALPQLFNFLFFFMLYLLGIGTSVSMMSCIVTAFRDRFRSLKNWHVALVIAVCGTIFGSIYMTPGGQSVLRLIDYYGASFIALILALAELIAFSYIYGVDRICNDVEFMLGFRPNLYWRICWKFVTPGLMAVILIYTLFTLDLLKDGDFDYPTTAHAIGMVISTLGLIQLPIFAVYAIYKQTGENILERVKAAFRPLEAWGPTDATLNKKYKDFVEQKKVESIDQHEKVTFGGLSVPSWTEICEFIKR